MVALVEQTLALHKQLPEAGTPHEKTALERQIEATDGQIDGGPALWADGGGDRDCGRKSRLREGIDLRRKDAMDLIYLDYNCFQRRFDDPSQIKIQLEALACEEIFLRAEIEEIQLAWSFMHEDETLLCPFPNRLNVAFILSTLCKMRIGPVEQIYESALEFQRRSKMTSKDAIHLACAHFIKADYFLSCDNRLVSQAKKLGLEMTILNPVEYIRMEDL
jgi:predicted nucleic acid-binding protein